MKLLDTFLFICIPVSMILTGCHSSNSISTPSPIEYPISTSSISKSNEAATAYAKGDNSKAISLCNDALKEDSHNYKALSLKGIALSMQGDPIQGESLILQALEINKNYTPAYYDLAIALKLQHKYEKSTEAFLRVIESDTTNTWSYYGIATNYSELRDKKNTLLYLDKAITYGGEPVQNIASTQDHFLWLHGDLDFDKRISPK